MYVVIEGIDGSGKTALVDALGRALGFRLPATQVYEPSNKGPGAAARAYFEGRSKGKPYHPLTAAGLMIGSQLDTVNRYEEQIAASDEVVLSDRGFLSTLAYQGPAVAEATRSPEGDLLNRTPENAAFDLLWTMQAGIPLPDLLIYLSCDPEVAAARAKRRTGRQAEHLDYKAIVQVDLAYTRALVWLREKLGDDWMRDSLLIVPVVEQGEREESVARPMDHIVIICARAIEEAARMRRERAP